MKVTRYLFIAATMLPAAAMAQTAVDALSIGQDDLRGTARFMSMGGAFGALGGDLSTLTQNPAGLGVYRSSEVGITMDIDIMSAKSTASGGSTTMDQTKVYCPNFGYVGSWSTGSSILPFFNWGVTYGRAKSFDRHYAGQISNMGTSLTNHVADFTSAEQWTPTDLYDGGGANPYWNGSAPWMSILMYNGCLINPTSGSSYEGLYMPGTSTASGQFNVEERGYVDEYSINFGGNFVNMVYWGLGIGIKDLSFDQWAYWSENVNNGMVPYQTSLQSPVETAQGGGSYDLNSYKHIWGNGVDVKFGLIFKPINEFRLGLAVHTPTWYNLQQSSSADVSGRFQATVPGVAGANQTYNFNHSSWTNNGSDDWFEWKYNTPWKLMVSAAGVIGKKGIVSLDYEYQPYNKMTVKTHGGYELPIVKEDIENYYQATSTIRLGAEYRVTPSFSLRAGYVYSSSPTKGESDIKSIENNGLNMDTDGPDDTGTTPSYALTSDTQYVTFGLGYRYQMFYIDAAYVYRTRSSTYHPWSGSDLTAKISQHDNNIVLSAGLKF